MEKLISIGIPNYNRAKELLRLLRSVDTAHGDDIEIVICDDKSPEIESVRAAVETFKHETSYTVSFFENEENCGYDKNLRNVIEASKGKWVLFMGNDDTFIPGGLDKLIGFLQQHPQCGYILRSYYMVHKNQKIERFRYYQGNTFFAPGLDACVALFRKSVFISGVTIKRNLAMPHLIDVFDGTLLFQLYLIAEIALHHPTAYFDEPLTQFYEDRQISEFGTAKAEEELFKPRETTVDGSVNFFGGFFRITRFLDKKYGINFTRPIQRDLSIYSYPNLARWRERGAMDFLRYAKAMYELGIGVTVYFYFYVVGLLFFGKNTCDNTIRILKNIVGVTPQL